MVRRPLVCALWFIAFFCLHELAWSTFGSPRVLGVVIGAFAAGFVWFDPLNLFLMNATIPADRRPIETGFEPR